jgi:DNA repair exonuclease SbcCD ATPase subunit
VEAELDSTEERLQSVNQQVAELRRKNDTLRPILEKSQRSQKLAEEVETDIRDRQAERERINHLETEQKELKKKLKGLEENPQVLRGPQPDPQPDPQPNQPPESQPHPPSNSQPDLPKQG